MKEKDLFRERFDYRRTPQGGAVATLTITTRGGEVRRFSAALSPVEVAALNIEEATHAAAMAGDEIGIINLRKLARGVARGVSGAVKAAGAVVRDVGKAAQSVLNSKVLKDALPVVSQIPGVGMVLQPVLRAQQALSAATAAERLGRKALAGKLTLDAVTDAVATIPGSGMHMLQMQKKKLDVMNSRATFPQAFPHFFGVPRQPSAPTDAPRALPSRELVVMEQAQRALRAGDLPRYHSLVRMLGAR